MLKKIITAELNSKNIIDNQSTDKDQSSLQQKEIIKNKAEKQVEPVVENTSKEHKDDSKT